jgi:mono/diheme cytochrome c family protein
VPELRTADRCVSCHVGMAPGETGVPGDPILGAHRDVAHDPAAFGCTVCHGGQGRATRTADAHGAVPHVPEPMLPRKYLWAGCGTCHTHLRVPNALVLERGQRFFEQRDCLACHRVDGRGGTARPGGAGGLEGPDLSRAGARGFRSDWYARHLAEKRTSKIPAWQTAFGEVPEEEREAIAVYLSARVGAPGLVEAKAAFHSLGCRGCHKVAGIGGDDGPDLTRAGQRDPGLTDFSHVAGPRTLESWWKEHFRAPATVVPGSPMPALGLSEAEIESLTFYLYSLRRSSFPESLWPKDRVLSERLGEREFASDGATLYGTFCAACHGPSGEGRRYPGMPAFPAIANPDFLRVASDDFLAATIRGGRPGRRMPAWGEGGGGLNSGDIEKLVAHLRKLGGGSAFVPDGKPRRWARGDVALGTSLFLANCAGCHGPDGAGNEGPALRNARLLEAASDSYLAETIRRGRHGTGMLGFAQSSSVQRALADGEIEALVSFIRTWEKKR